MRRSFLLYLFVFTALLAIFMYVTGQRMLEAKEEKIEDLEAELLVAERTADSSVASNVSDSDSFSLVANEEALSYLESRGFNSAEIINKVEDKIISGNKADADHELIPYEGMQGFFRINKVKLLNHKWGIASFTDGSYWGDLFFSFEIDDNGNIDITTEKAVLYPRN